MTVSTFYGKPIYAFMPIEAGGVNSMLPIAGSGPFGPAAGGCATAWAVPSRSCRWCTFTIGGGACHAHGDWRTKRATPAIFRDGHQQVDRGDGPGGHHEPAAASVSVSLYAMDRHSHEAVRRTAAS